MKRISRVKLNRVLGSMDFVEFSQYIPKMTVMGEEIKLPGRILMLEKLCYLLGNSLNT